MIKFINVNKWYNNSIKALSDINVNIDKGEFIILTGHSGAGKTTLIELIHQSIKPEQGEILINGKNIITNKQKEISLLRRKIGVVFQDFKILYNKTVYENVAIPLILNNEKKKNILKKSEKVLKDVNLWHKKDSLPHNLSFGEQQRITIARAVINNPMILLADEPTGNLDHALGNEIFELFYRINLRGTTVILATHEKNYPVKTGMRIIKLKDGKIII